MTTFRREKMSEAIRKVVSDKLLKSHSLIPNAMVTINRVDVTPDYSLAKIYYSVFGNNLAEPEAASIMKEHCSEFRYEISQKLNLRRTPKVEFCFDKNTEYAFKIDNLLKSNAEEQLSSQHD